MCNCEPENNEILSEVYSDKEIEEIAINKSIGNVTIYLKNKKVISIEPKLNVWGKGIEAVIDIKRGYKI